jgi:hypothetical protein
VSAVAELLTALEAEVTADGEILLAKLRDELNLDYWPERTFAAARACFGEGVYNRAGRTYKALDRRVRHALRVWDEKYGPLNAEQAAYADEVLARAIQRGETDAGQDRAKRYRFVQATIGRAVNHEVIDAGFKRRATVEQMVDITAELADVLASQAVAA